MVMNAQNTMAQAQNLCFFIETIPIKIGRTHRGLRYRLRFHPRHFC